MEDRLLTDEQVAELAQIPVSSVRYFRATGKLPFLKIGRHPRVRLSVFWKVFGESGTMQVIEDGQRSTSDVTS